LRNNFKGLRGPALAALLAIPAFVGMVGLGARPAQAEFEIQESEVEKGEVEVEYRGAVHWGVPKPGAEDDQGGEEEAAGDGVLEEEDVEAGLQQSHDLEFQYGLTDRVMFSTTLITEEPVGDNYDLSGVELEGQYELVEREGDGLGLAFIGAYGFATRSGEADEIEFGPIVELASGPVLLTFNPFLASQVGDNRETDGLGFEYGWRAEYKVASHWGVGVEMFGEIEDLSHSGPFDDQEHSIGPTLFYNPGDEDDDVGGEGDDDEEEIAGEPEMELYLNVGLQFGLTDMTSDTALKFQGSLSF
jgi:hypothetical protein